MQIRKLFSKCENKSKELRELRKKTNRISKTQRLKFQIFPAQVFPANVLFNKHTYTWKRGLGVGNGGNGEMWKSATQLTSDAATFGH